MILRISSYFKGIFSHVHLPLFVGSGSTVKFLPHRAGPAQVKGLMGMSKALDILYLYILYIYIYIDNDDDDDDDDIFLVVGYIN